MGYVGIEEDYYVSVKSVLDITAETGALTTQSRIRELTPADVAPVVHGRWIDMGDHGDWQWETDGRGNCWHLWECNRCNGKVKIKSDYCPNCGAKMDGERKE